MATDANLVISVNCPGGRINPHVWHRFTVAQRNMVRRFRERDGRRFGYWVRQYDRWMERLFK